MNTSKRYHNNDETPNNPGIPKRTPILSISELSEQHYEIFISKLNTLHHDTNETRTDNHTEDIADMISEQITILDEMKLHLETSRTLLLFQTITHCPECGYNFQTKKPNY
jgi:hypothetical protein